MSSRIDIILLLALIEWVVSKGQLLKQISLIYDPGPSICSSNNSEELLIRLEKEISSFLTNPRPAENITVLQPWNATLPEVRKRTVRKNSLHYRSATEKSKTMIEFHNAGPPFCENQCRYSTVAVCWIHKKIFPSQPYCGVPFINRLTLNHTKKKITMR